MVKELGIILPPFRVLVLCELTLCNAVSILRAELIPIWLLSTVSFT